MNCAMLGRRAHPPLRVTHSVDRRGRGEIRDQLVVFRDSWKDCVGRTGSRSGQPVIDSEVWTAPRSSYKAQQQLRRPCAWRNWPVERHVRASLLPFLLQCLSNPRTEYQATPISLLYPRALVSYLNSTTGRLVNAKTKNIHGAWRIQAMARGFLGFLTSVPAS